MNATAKNILKNVFPRPVLYIRAFNQLFINPQSCLYTTGWLKSLQGDKPVDYDGYEVPWMNYAVIKFLEARLKKDFHLFEFGSGYSTSFYARLAGSVTSLEHDELWFQTVKERVPENVEVVFKPADTDGEYCRAINRSGQKYEVVIVDGMDRVNCIKQSANALSERGVILLDDSHRKEYAEGFDFLKDKDFRALPFEGLKPTSNKVEKTTVFYRRENCFEI
jgi:hypothetical protein